MIFIRQTHLLWEKNDWINGNETFKVCIGLKNIPVTKVIIFFDVYIQFI